MRERAAHRRYRKRPLVIEAVQWTGSNVDDMLDFIGLSMHSRRSASNPNTLVIETLEGEMAASPGDWIIKGVSGEFYPCKPDIFEKTYEVVA